MSIECKATIYYGFELAEEWNKIVDEEYFEDYIDCFIILNPCGRCDDPILFAIEVEKADEGQCIEINMKPYIAAEDEQILNEFCIKYPEAITWHTPNYYLMCQCC